MLVWVEDAAENDNQIISSASNVASLKEVYSIEDVEFEHT